MTSAHAHQLKREHYARQWVVAVPAPMRADPPCLAVGTRVIVHRRISERGVPGAVIGGHGQDLRVRADAGAHWTVRRDRLTVVRRIEAWDVLRRAENIFKFRAMDQSDAEFERLHNRAVCIAARANARMGV